jgi:FKBP-type peptidyl-prolyl cis-trans isomerase SlyD
VLDSSSGGDPLAYLHGQGNIVPGLEKALEGRQVGDKLDVRVTPAEGYGVRDEKLVQSVPRRAFGSIKKIEPGMQFHAQDSRRQAQVITVKHVKGDMVTIDGNHPLAGEHLNFAVEITGIREPTSEEIAHGRARSWRTSPPRLTPCGSRSLRQAAAAVTQPAAA